MRKLTPTDKALAFIVANETVACRRHGRKGCQRCVAKAQQNAGQGMVQRGDNSSNHTEKK